MASFLGYVAEAELEGRPEQISEYAIGLEVYNRGKDFDPKLDATVRVEARRLRKALDLYYESDGRDEPVRIGIPKGGYAPVFEQHFSPSTRSPRSPWTQWAVPAVVVLGLTSAAWLKRPSPPQSIERVPRQLTTDPGLTGWPDITPDGQWIVYASDRDGGPDLDLWVRHADRDDARQLTDMPGDEFLPRFAPDGSLVAFTSSADASVHVVPAVGGQPRRISDNSRIPRFSPDSRQLAFGRARAGWSSQLVVADLTGEHREYGNEMAWSGAGNLWLPDGSLLSGGTKSYKPLLKDWWIVPLDGSSPAGTGATRYLSAMEMVRAPPFPPQAWLEPEQGVLFSARDEDYVDLWLMPMSLESRRVTGPPIRVTRGADMEYDAGASRDGRIVYSSATQRRDLWRLPIDAATGEVGGLPERLTAKVAGASRPTVSADGSVAVFLRSRSTLLQHPARLELSALPNFAPEPLLQGEERDFNTPRVDATGKQLFYEVQDPSGVRTVYRMDLQSGVTETIRSGKDRFVGLSPDGRWLLVRPPSRESGIWAVDLSSGESLQAAKHGVFSLQDPRVSPDGRSIAFHANTSGSQRRQIFVAPFQPGDPPPVEEWTPVAEPETNSSRAEWSPNGKILYYLSDQTGPYAIWAQPIEPETKEPAGEPWIVYESGNGGPSIHIDMVVPRGLPSLAVAPDAILFDVTEQRSNIWMLEPKE